MATAETNHNSAGNTTWNQQSQAAFNQRSAAEYATHLLPHIEPSHRILDVGCGPGSITLDLAKLVPEGHVVGVDINADALSTARASAKERGISNVEFVEGDAQDLGSFDDDSFDIVHAHQLLLHLSKAKQALQEMRRVVKRGGLVSTRDSAAMIRVPIYPAIERQVEMFHDYSRNRGSDPLFGRASHVAAHEAGFEWQDIQMSSWSWEWSSKEAKKNMAELGKDGLRKLFVAAGVGTENEVDKAAAAWDDWKDKPDARIMGLDGAILCLKQYEVGLVGPNTKGCKSRTV